MKHKILAVCMALVLSFVSVLPAHAASGVIEAYVVSNFADWLCRGAQSTFNKFWASATGQDFICPENHNTVDGAGYHNFVDRYTLGPDGKFGHYYVCEYCETLLDDVFPEAYDSYSSSLPAQSYGKGGYLYTIMPVSSFGYSISSTLSDPIGVSFEQHGTSISFSGTSPSKNFIKGFVLRYGSVVVPANCSYRFYDYQSVFNLHYRKSDGFNDLSVSSGSNNVGSWVYVSETKLVSKSTTKDFSYTSAGMVSGTPFTGTVTGLSIIEILPDSVPPEFSQESRPSSFNNSGALGVQTGDGDLTVLDHSNIVDETNNTYYNPVTQTDNSITNWTYDYSTRTYNVTLDNGQTVTVTYGDENITINEGDTVYNVYYVYQGTGPDPTPTPGPGGDTHQHNYTSEDTKAPTCTMPGTRKFTCEECGDTYTKAIPATGHDWQVKTEVKTEYGEDGELLQEGYTIYQCSVCGEEYKSTAETGPPPSGGGSTGDEDEGGGSGIGDALADLFGVIGDLLTGLLGGAVELFTSLIGGLGEIFQQIITFSSGFIDLLSALFPFIPKEIMMAISAGIIIMIVLAILKFIRG